MLIKWLKWFKAIANRNPKLVWGFFIGAGALLYLKVWLPLTRIGIPCVFHEVTGLYCPGCGMTRAALALLELDFGQAFRYNLLIFFLVPLYAVYVLAHRKQWRRTGRFIMAIMLAATILFGVLRNFPAFHWLAPSDI
ncbi:DUF2752 domain-containing protein [Paenibacillus nanensis]|uniref:DUF2752 domain-containing protein n=1 Tax=Paenibacillus nanensis TaxID=393251 RepID=A0A3A1UUK8_9BACL|nr:DUF2752 domain-containing protein [Paenibacillus nanensis]RIX51456.1 DUF2752 domain-containing protein [Paenibacillus nanensis]